MAAKRSRILEEVHESVSGMYRLGIIDAITMHKFDVLCLQPIKPLSPTQIRRIRTKHGLSQVVFAHYLNTSPSTVRQWEQGKKRPSGPALRLLDVVSRLGLEVLERPRAA
jgi:putative transcriptional regulator